MSTPAAARKQKSREREAAGRLCLMIEMNAAELEALLADAGCLNGMTEATRASASDWPRGAAAPALCRA